VTDLRARIASADAILFSTPEYAGDAGVVEEPARLDSRGVEISDKPTAWINISTSPAGAQQRMNR
jgi:hypothetical protein